ncbi:hypothetical protein SMB34_13835 [Thalassospira permensis NBRC 106175]|jgi:hypothetical protein|uniref:Uncharacterized protein n=1 Tax=Thalassospira permensis NBRC 106175 TaxID=1353532 RepID=A0ABR4TSD1_9PROT|nr:hypothetical protein SMB34_13835 [Thalassospira permensis NBRC 106175]
MLMAARPAIVRVKVEKMRQRHLAPPARFSPENHNERDDHHSLAKGG